MKYLIVGKENIYIKTLIQKIKDATDLRTAEDTDNGQLMNADAILTDIEKINRVAEKFPDTAFYVIYAPAETNPDTEEYRQFYHAVEDRLQSSKIEMYNENVMVFQKIDSDDFDPETIAEKMKNTLKIHRQLCEITQEMTQTNTLGVRDNKIITYVYNSKNGEIEEDLQSIDQFANQLIFDSEGFDKLMKQWLYFHEDLKPSQTCNKRKAIYETLNDFYMTIYHIFGENIIIHNDMDVFWIEDPNDVDNLCDDRLIEKLEEYYHVDSIKKIITDDEYACLLLK